MVRWTWKHFPLLVKLTLAITGLIVLIVASITLFSIQRERQAFRQELQHQATLLLDILEVAIADSLYYLDADMLSDIMEALGRDREILVSGHIYDTEGRLIADAYSEELTYSVEIDPFGRQLVESHSPVFEWKSNHLIAGRPVIVGRQRLGAVSIGISTDPLKSRLVSMRNQGILIALAAVIIGTMLAGLISRSITRPIEILVSATERIAKGDLRQEIVTQSDGELAALGNAMERMRSELQRFYEMMGQLVAERTQQLQESEARFRHVIASISDHIYMADLTEDGKWINRYLSPKIETLTGYRHEKFMEDFYFWPSLICPDDMATVDVQLARFFSGQNSEVEYRLNQKDGTVIWVRDSGRVETYTGQKNKTVYGVVSDITQRKRAEEEQLRLETQLQSAQKLETIGKLAGGAAHEFNNILAILLGTIELIMNDLPEDSPEKAKLEQAYKTGERGQALVQQILIFSRSSRQALQPMRLAPILQNAIKMTTHLLPSSVELRSQIDPACPPVLTNPIHIEQIVINLCKNAVQAMDNQDGNVEITLEEIDSSGAPNQPNLSKGRYARLMVRDDGSGMPPDVKNHIFDPFFSTREIGKGTGLGLSLVHGIVQQHGGRMNVDSEPGKGTTFEILLPVFQELSQPETLLETSPEKSQQDYRKPGVKEHVLLVDDHPDLLKLPVMALEKLGYRVTVISETREALECFRTDPQQFDVVITALTMPEMTGLDLCRELVKIRSDLPLILCMETHESVETRIAEEIGIARFLQKPLKIRQLTQTLRELFLSSHT